MAMNVFRIWKRLMESGAICSREEPAVDVVAKKIQKLVRLQQRNWDVGTEAIASTEVTSSTEATAIEYDRWAYGTNV
jgi:hypothetical protein